MVLIKMSTTFVCCCIITQILGQVSSEQTEQTKKEIIMIRESVTKRIHAKNNMRTHNSVNTKSIILAL